MGKRAGGGGREVWGSKSGEQKWNEKCAEEAQGQGYMQGEDGLRRMNVHFLHFMIHTVEVSTKLPLAGAVLFGMSIMSAAASSSFLPGIKH